MYVTEQLPDGRRQLEPAESFSALRQFSDMRQPGASAYHGGVQNQENGDGRHQSAPADGRRHAPMCVTGQLPDGRRQLGPEVSFSDMRQPGASAYHGTIQSPWVPSNEHSMYCVYWTSWKSSVAVTNG